MRDCIIKEDDLIKYAVELGHEVVAITDHESIMNAIKVEKVYKKIKEKNPNFKVIFGNEIYLCRNGLNNENFITGQDRYYHFLRGATITGLGEWRGAVVVCRGCGGLPPKVCHHAQ